MARPSISSDLQIEESSYRPFSCTFS